MLRLPRFRYFTPASLDEAADMLTHEGAGAGGSVRLVAGGTDLWPNMKRRHQMADSVISLMHVPGMSGISFGDGGELRIGATTTLRAIESDAMVRARFPALAAAIESISTPVLRNMGTIGGNLCLDTRCTYYNQNEEWRRAIGYCMKSEGAVCWVAPSSPRCWAIAASDSAPMLIALGARVRLVSGDGDRVIPLSSLYENDGIDYLAKRPDEVLTDVIVPSEAAADHCRAGWFKLRRRGSIDFAVASVAAAVRTSAAGIVESAEIVLGAVASWPAKIEATALVGKRLGDDAAIDEVARAARKVATPLDNTDFNVVWRSQMVERITAKVLRGL
jgi:4-hydroxybenzoyl-CoA reductase subunit beta